MRFTKLRLTGFKSFVEPTEFEIPPGLTGIVGPNGCGKSNLVEALRWVMGETRVKQLRGGEMDDIIFAGTQNRPARDAAEVSLVVENNDRKAPPAWNDLSEIEITRRIERGQGSTYHIAAREARQRDVQFFFADIASGAHSPALVSQGRIGAIIAAKPTERRALLEEAAGITGLHSRRHEAELKLKAAESNLARLDDVLITLDQQLDALKKQARQAARYRNMSDMIRRAEAGVLTWKWRGAAADVEATGARLAEAEALVMQTTEAAAVAATALAEAEAALPELRKDEVEKAAAIQRLVLARERLEVEERNARARLAEAIQRLAQIAADHAREEGLIADAARAGESLAQERARLEAEAGEAAALLDDLTRRLEAQRAAVEAADQALAAATAAHATAEAERAALARRQGEITQRLERLAQRRDQAESDRATVLAETIADPAAVAAAVAEANAAFIAARARAEEIETRRRAAEAEQAAARAALGTAEAELAQLDAEVAGLTAVLASGDEGYRAVLDDVAVEPGYETALAVALGDDLSAPIDGAAPRAWRSDIGVSGTGPALPDGAVPLSQFVRGPAALGRRLAQIGVVNDAAGEMLALALHQGQRLVSPNGALWRWDGFTVRAGTPASAAARLAQRNRLNALGQRRPEMALAADLARARAATAQDHARVELAAESQARDDMNRMIGALDAARAAENAAAQAAAQREARLDALDRLLGELADETVEQNQAAEDVAARAAALPDPELGRATLAAERVVLGQARATLAEFEARAGQMRRAAEAREQRLETIARETESWARRGEAATAQLSVLVTRAADAGAERDALDGKPEAIAQERHGLGDLIQAAEAARQDAGDRLAQAERLAAETARALKAREGEMAAAREDRVRAEAARDQAHAHRDEVVARIRDRLDCAPEETLALTGHEADDLPPLAQCETRLDRLTKERDNMGPVNLRAEAEAQEINAQVETMRAEREDLTRAIARLRQAIGQLNREGRERLLAAFESVNKHFQELFTKLFGGGRAHLTLAHPIGENGEVIDEPLEAGLEVMASPPGKKLQSLTLLSGGEQALTALALLFAVFMTNPAPICVLDEVDAPLDDANVDRFCRLLDVMTQNTQTRFIVVTHHRMTMARMDRLFGVTMAERGVSQLVSVDLAGAARMRATA